MMILQGMMLKHHRIILKTIKNEWNEGETSSNYVKNYVLIGMMFQHHHIMQKVLIWNELMLKHLQMISYWDKYFLFH